MKAAATVKNWRVDPPPDSRRYQLVDAEGEESFIFLSGSGASSSFESRPAFRGITAGQASQYSKRESEMNPIDEKTKGALSDRHLENADSPSTLRFVTFVTKFDGYEEFFPSARFLYL
jgi:hypothetical protein